MWAPKVICHQLRAPENLGAIARLMANFGFDQLILSDPVTHDFRGAETTAVGAEHLLRGLAVAPTLKEALKGVVYAVGSTSRQALKRAQPLTVSQAVQRLAENAARGPVGLVLGGEKRGLSDDELALCQDVVVIDTPGPQPSMNVSQAAAVLFHACSQAHAAPVHAEAVRGATLAEVHGVEEVMQEVLLEADFLNRQAPQHVMRELSKSLTRGGLTPREAQLWRSAFEHVKRVMPKKG